MQSDFRFSVLMSLYGKEKPEHFREAFESIYHYQTYKPDEIVLVLDGPLPDQLQAEVKRIRDHLRTLVKIVELASNQGLAGALNFGLTHCSHEWVFRMDTDDVALPNRFQVQVDHLKKHPNIDVLGSLIEEFDPADSRYSVIRHVPEKHKDIVRFAKSRNPINHPACCFKKQVVNQIGGYPLVYPEDYILWIKLIQAGYQFHNIQTPLLKMRTGSAFIKRRGIDMLKGELNIYRHMRKTGFINNIEFLVIAALRAIVRLAPGWFKVFSYRFLR